MTIFYLDPTLGSDAASGADWNNAWKTFTLGATAARIAPGDIIWVAKSPDPTAIGSCTWNNLSRTVTLPTEQTLDVDQCETIWTAGTADVTPSVSATAVRQGTNHATLTVGAAFTTGKIAYKALGTTVDFSAFQQLSFWFRSSVLQAAGAIKVCLCSDASGNTIVNNFLLPAIDTTMTAAMRPYTIDNGSALGSSIQSVALYAVSDPGTATLMIDNIMAVKAVGSADSLSLTSLISKNSLATGGDEAWYPIQSIVGTNVQLDNHPANPPGEGRGYFGVSETVASYKRETHQMLVATDGQVMDSGVSGNMIQFRGGYNRTNSVQDGETFLSWGCGLGLGLNFIGMSYVLMNRINPIRSSTGINLPNAATIYNQITGHTIAAQSTVGLSMVSCNNNQVNFRACINSVAGISLATAPLYGNRVNIALVNNHLGVGVSIASNCYLNVMGHEEVCNNVGYGVSLTAVSDNTVKVGICKYNTTYGVGFLTNSRDNVLEVITEFNTTGGIYSDTACRNYLRNSTINEASKVLGFGAGYNGRVHSSYEGGNPANNYVYFEGGLIRSQAGIRHTAAGIAWSLAPLAIRTELYPLILSVAKIAVNAGTAVTVSLWAYRDNTAVNGRLMVRKWQLPGMTVDYTDGISVGQDTWEQLSVTFTPTIAGVFEVQMLAWGGSTYNVYIDDLTYSQA